MEAQKSKVSRASTLLDAVTFLVTFKTREERNEILENDRMSLLPEEYVDRYEQLRKNEYHHVKHARATYERIFPGTKCIHDHTKDEFYIFITVVAFDFKMKDDLDKDLWQSELDRHFGAEPHHPEYEKINKDKGLRLTDDDIAEMAVDRLSRNLQFSGGQYNDESLSRFEPKFEYDGERRIEVYRKRVKEFKETAKKVWDELKQK